MTLSNNRPMVVATTLCASAVLALGTLALPSQAAEHSGGHAARTSGHGDVSSRGSTYVDRRQLGAAATVRSDRARLSDTPAKTRRYQRSLGALSNVDYDPLTRTVRNLGRLDGYLTGPSSAPARQIALAYVRSHLHALGLGAADVATFHFRQDYVDASGLHNLSWSQSARGISVFGNGLKVKVTARGQVLSVQGSPVAGLAAMAARADATAAVGAGAARTEAARNVGARPSASATVDSTRAGTTRWSNHDFATRVWFLTPSGLRLGWSTYTQTGDGKAFQHVVDAGSGAVLYRRSTTDDLRGDSYTYDNYPGAASGGTPKVVNFISKGWLNPAATFLNGNSVIAWDDLNDDNAISTNEITPVPGASTGAQFALRPFGPEAGASCATYVCSWNPNAPYSWRVNRDADADNAFYLASNFHDYLAKPPIDFTAAAGNFSRAGGDPVLLNALDGANTTGDGFPDGNHIDNANMNTPPDGTPPTMQMYLWHQPGATQDQDPFVPTSGSLDASILYHEYTHGLSNRLVVDADGNSTLNDIQAGAMGEAWSDYYALDYLVHRHLIKDTGAAGQVLEGEYVTQGAGIRTMAIDCPVAATAATCTRVDGTTGGYTYADFPTVTGGPEVHSSGEVWAQTLWDLRRALGHTVADGVITRGMSLSADDPDYLDMRNAIIQADQVRYGGSHIKTIWRVFAHRGMGFYAGSLNSADTQPANDFHVPPPASTPKQSLSGFVTDPATGDPVAGAVVTVSGQPGQFSTVTNANGHYAIHGLVAGTYKKVGAAAPGYVPDDKPGRTGTRVDFSIERDWAAATGGAEITDFNGGDFTAYGCGPTGAIDLSLGTGWGSTTGDDNGTPTNVFVPKHITVALPSPVDVSDIGVDPSATCGDGASASTAGYRIETSPDGTTWTTASEGTFTSADLGQINDVPLTGGTEGVRYVRFTMLSNQTPDFTTSCPNGAFSGCSYTDMSELEVFGAPAG